MPNKPTLMSIDFSPPHDGEREINVTWTGTPERPGPSRMYIGKLVVPTTVSLRDDDGSDLYRWHLATIPVDADFLVPTKEATDSRPLAAARWMIRAAYRACGYGLFSPPGTE